MKTQLLSLISMGLIFSAACLAAAAPAPTPAPVLVQKGVSIFYCNDNPAGYFVDSTGHQRALEIDVEYSDVTISMVVNPPYSVSAPGMDNSGNTNNVCFTVTKE